MKRRSRPVQHRRRLPSGRVITVNRGVKRRRFVKHPSPNEFVDDYLLRRFEDLDNYPKTVKLYHGTTLPIAKKIKAEGLKPQSVTGNRNFRNISPLFTDKVFLAQNKHAAMWWALQNKNGGEPVILEVDVPFEDYRKGLFDYQERYLNDRMVKGEDRDEVLLSSVPAKNIKKIIPYSNAIIEKELSSEHSLNNLDLEKDRLLRAKNNFKKIFEGGKS